MTMCSYVFWSGEILAVRSVNEIVGQSASRNSNFEITENKSSCQISEHCRELLIEQLATSPKLNNVTFVFGVFLLLIGPLQ